MSSVLAALAASTESGVIGLASALGVGLLFTHAALAKLRHREVMSGIVANYRIVPTPMVDAVAKALPIVELAVGLALLAGGQRLAVLPAALLLLVFAGAMAINIRRGRNQIDCGCGGSQLRQTLSWPLVWRNLLLAAMVAFRLLPAPALGGFDLATALVGGACLFLMTLLFNAIGTLAASPLAASQG